MTDHATHIRSALDMTETWDTYTQGVSKEYRDAALAALAALEQERDVWASKSQEHLAGWNAATERAEAAEQELAEARRDIERMSKFGGSELINQEWAELREIAEGRRDAVPRVSELIFKALASFDAVQSRADITEARAMAAEAELAEAKQAVYDRDEYSRKTGCDCHETSTGDQDYSPAYQDNYQRLWHETAARAEAAEAELAEARSALTYYCERMQKAEAERDKLREALREIPEAMDSCVEYMEAAEKDGLEPWSVAATTVRAHCFVVAEDVRAALAGKEGT